MRHHRCFSKLWHAGAKTTIPSFRFSSHFLLKIDSFSGSIGTPFHGAVGRRVKQSKRLKRHWGG
jgi:hypothetical protein